MKHSLLHVFALSSLSLTTCTLGTFAWVFPPITTSSTRASSHRISSSSSSSQKSLPQQQQQQQSEDDIKHDIEVMHQQAMERLNQLSHRMEELFEQQTALEAHEADHPHQHQHHARTTTSISSSIHQHTEKATHDKIQARNVPSTATTVNVTKKPKAAKATTTTTTTETTTASSSFFETPVDTTITTADNSAVDAEAETSIEPRMDACPNLLDDTTWKIAMDIHREQGTWMPEEWGKSDEHCRCQVVVDFTSEPVCYEDNDDFFMDLVKNSNNGVASVAVGGSSSGSSSCPVKVLKVDEAWIYPHGVGRESVGQRPLPVEMEGAYKVALGQGPFGTHVVRFCLTVTEDVRSCPESDIYIPAGRIYGTLGYYPQHFRHTSTVKDKALAEYQEMVLREAELQRKSEEQQDGLLSIMDQVKRFKELWGLRKQMEKQAEKVREARQRDPDRHQLRLSRQGNVGLSREGGLCCKVQNGVAMEYRIIGKMEVGSVDFHHYHHSMDEAHNLHP